MLTTLLLAAALMFAPPRPPVAPAPVARADVAAVTYVQYSGTWYALSFDFRAKVYSCPNPNDEHGAWTGEVDSWDAATGTLVFREAYVVCRPDGLPEPGPLSLVRMRFFRGVDGSLRAEAAGGSWAPGEVEFR